MRLLSTSLIAVAVGVAASTVSCLCAIPVAGVIDAIQRHYIAYDIWRGFVASCVLAFLAAGAVLMLSILGILILWGALWLPLYVLRAGVKWFWCPMICVPIGAMSGVLLLLILRLPLGSHLTLAFNPAYVGAFVGGGALFYSGHRSSNSAPPSVGSFSSKTDPGKVEN
jgi:hypothetical protein